MTKHRVIIVDDDIDFSESPAEVIASQIRLWPLSA